MGKTIVVPSFEPVVGPLIFLAGPIQSATDWQARADALLRSWSADINVANPRSPPPWHGDYDRQTAWEHRYLERARTCGCVLFWLAKEDSHDCSRAYAQTTRFELGWHFWCHVRDGAPLAVGIEPGFSNERYIRLTLGMYAPDIAVRSTLEETCLDAIRLASKNRLDP